VWVNGRRGSAVACNDRGLQYGDGLFETMRVAGRQTRLLDYHLDRLLSGCRALGIGAPSRHTLHGEITRAASACGAGVLKLIVTRGPGSRGYRPTGLERSTRILSCHAAPAYDADEAACPVRVRVCATHMGVNARLAGLKSLNRLESVLARAEWRDARIWEGLMLDTDENLVSGTMSNLFVRRGPVILTPLLDRCGVAGVMRRWILRNAGKLGFEVRERRLRWRDLRHCDEAFMSNALVGVKSVRRIERGRERLAFGAFDAAARFRGLLHP
jgi:4-amino-4-deoxychorismate lyase